MGAVASFTAMGAVGASPGALSERLSNRLGLKTSERELNRQVPAEGNASSSSSYLRPVEVIPQLTWCLQRHAWLMWVGLPAWAVIEACVPRLQATAATSFSNLALVVLLLVELHHIYAEQQAWALAKNLCSTPELIVMRQLGLLKQRSRLVPIGVLEVLDIYTDLVFPSVAFTCEPSITRRWIGAWRVVPGIGSFLSKVVSVLLFWRAAAVFVLATVAISLFYLWSLISTETARTERLEQPGARVTAEDFFLLARYANMAAMPSVAALCEEMAAQRRWVYDSTKDAAESAQTLEEFKWGWADRGTAMHMEVRNQEQQEKQESASKSYFTLLLIHNVIISNCVQIYFQGTFFSLSFNDTGREAKAKVIISMTLSTVIAFFRCKSTAGHLGCFGFIIMFLVALFAAWMGLRMYHTFACEDHLWNLTTGCVPHDS